MKLKKSYIIFLMLFSGLLFAKPVLAEDAISSDNTPMGHYIEQEQSQEASKENTSDSSTTTPSIRARSFAAVPAANVPSDLKSDDNTLPRKDAVDIASYQSWMTQADFNSLKTSGVKSIVVKLTEGTNYTNPYAANQIKMAQNAGLNVAVYHYARLTGANSQSDANSLAIQEAAYFAKVAKSFGLSSNIVMIMDCEQPYRDGSGNIIGPNPIKVDWATAGVQFANTLKTNGYSNTKFYTSASWIGTNTATCQMNYNTLGGPKNLWAAQYLYGKPSSSNLQNTQYGAWQYTSQMYYQGTSNLKANAVDTSIDYSNFFVDSSKPITYTINFNTNGGNNINSQNITAGNKIIQPTNPTKTGYNFSGWYSDSDLTHSYNFSSIVNSNMTLYAKWIPNSSPSISYQAQVQGIGWQGPSYNGESSGTTGRKLRAEALKVSLLNLSSTLAGSNIKYQAYVQDIGWQTTIASAGMVAGTVGKSKQAEAIRLQLTGPISQQYDIYYRVHVQSIGWMAWAKNWQTAGTSDMTYRIESFQIQLVKKGLPTPSSSGSTSFSYINLPKISYSAHIQELGWLPPMTNGSLSGTVGRALRVEGLKVRLENITTGISGKITYRSQIQNISWQNWVENNEISGTVGRSLRDESVQIKLSGTLATCFNVYYRAHIQNIGWQGWVTNGATSGTTGRSLRMEAVEIKIIPKDHSGPK
ncbi:InlB B-repeat-containing protein [Lactococcus lactis]|nr:InlB B-repeat-containing protein [Lactococcus lactis]